MRIKLVDPRHAEHSTHDLFYEGGIGAFVKYLDRNKTPLLPDPIAITCERDGIGIEVAIEWNDSYYENVLCFTNNIPQRDGGTHLAGLPRRADRVRSTAMARSRGIARRRRRSALTGEDMREGLTAIVLGQAARPQILVARPRTSSSVLRGPPPRSKA